MYHESFVVLCREGKKTLADLDDFIADWNKVSSERKLDLRIELGLTDEEYNRFVLGEVEQVFLPLINYKFKYDWELTGPAFPEQYDLYKKGTRKVVAYVRERWNDITVDCPFVMDERVYDSGGDVTMREKIEIESAVENWYKEHRSIKDLIWIAKCRHSHKDLIWRSNPKHKFHTMP